MTESRYKLHLGDCLEVMRGMEAQSVDAIITDLPYQTTACSWDTIIPFAPMWEAVRHVLKPRGAFVTTASQPFTSKLIMSNLDWFKYCWVYKKPQGVDPFMSSIRPLNDIEDVVVFSEGRTVYNPQKTTGKAYRVVRDKTPRLHEVTGQVMRQTETVNAGERMPTRVIEFNQEKEFHPTQKPVALYEYLIRTYTNEGDTVLDMTAGSGTTGVAAMRTGRKFIGIELDPAYFAIAQERIANAAGEIVVTAKEKERGMVSLFDWAGQD